jgi:hypothetical protein
MSTGQRDFKYRNKILRLSDPPPLKRRTIMRDILPLYEREYHEVIGDFLCWIKWRIFRCCKMFRYRSTWQIKKTSRMMSLPKIKVYYLILSNSIFDNHKISKIFFSTQGEISFPQWFGTGKIFFQSENKTWDPFCLTTVNQIFFNFFSISRNLYGIRILFFKQ